MRLRALIFLLLVGLCLLNNAQAASCLTRDIIQLSNQEAHAYQHVGKNRGALSSPLTKAHQLNLRLLEQDVCIKRYLLCERYIIYAIFLLTITVLAIIFFNRRKT